MEKRLPLALFLSFLVLVGWQMCQPPPQRPARTTADAPEGGGPTVAPPDRPDFEPTAEVLAAEAERSLELFLGREGEPGRYRAVFQNRGALLTELSTAEYIQHADADEEARRDPAEWVELLDAVPGGPEGSLALFTRTSSEPLAPLGLDDVLWVMRELRDEGGASGVVFEYAPGTGVRFEKRVERVPGRRELAVSLTLTNESLERAGAVQFALRPASGMAAELDDSFYREPSAVAAGPRGGDELELDSAVMDATARDRSGPLNAPLPLSFGGVHNKYFAALLRGDDDDAQRSLQGARYRRVPDPRWAEAEGVPPDRALRYVECELDLALELPPAGQSKTWKYRLYAGPKKRDVLENAFSEHRALVEEDLGFFSGIGSLLLAILGFFHGIVGNWGVAIILLTVLVRAVLFPLNRRSQTAMARHAKKMKRVQPLLDEVKKKHAKDPQKMRQEQARVMQEEGAFPPLGGCLPVFLQIPVFFGLFSALRTSFDLRQAPFAGWVSDLSQPDRLAPLGWNLFLFEIEYLNLLPILMVVLWIWQQKTMPTPSDEQAARMQKMMMFVTVGMGFFLYEYASGLSLYMITQSSLGIFEQKVIKKLWPVDDAELAKQKKPGCGPFSGFMERLAEQHKEQLKRLQEQERQRAAQKKKAKRKARR